MIISIIEIPWDNPSENWPDWKQVTLERVCNQTECSFEVTYAGHDGKLSYYNPAADLLVGPPVDDEAA